MANIFNVAKYILEKEGTISTWKLQKLCYYCQAWAIAWTEHPIFAEDFEAWANGPVCPQLFQQHKGKYLISNEDVPTYLCDEDGITDDQQDTIDRVLDFYGKYEPYELREQTHSETPWISAREGLPDDGWCNNTISKSSMGAYYGSL